MKPPYFASLMTFMIVAVAWIPSLGIAQDSDPNHVLVLGFLKSVSDKNWEVAAKVVGESDQELIRTQFLALFQKYSTSEPAQAMLKQCFGNDATLEQISHLSLDRFCQGPLRLIMAEPIGSTSLSLSEATVVSSLSKPENVHWVIVAIPAKWEDKILPPDHRVYRVQSDQGSPRVSLSNQIELSACQIEAALKQLRQ